MKLLSRRVLLFIQIIITAGFGFIIYRLEMVPLRYLIIAEAVLLIIFLLLYKGQKKKEDNTISIYIYKIISLLLSIALVFAGLKITEGSNLLDVITGADSQTVQVSVIALKNSSVDTIEDLEGKTFGVCSASDVLNLNKAKAKIEEEIGTIDLTDYDSQANVAKALYNQGISAMILREVDRDIVEESYSNFNDDTKVIETYKFKIATAKANSAQVTKEAFNVFIGGTDQNGDISTAGLSDVNMIATVNPVTKQLYLTSIPRDYYVDIDGYNGKDKLTHSARSSNGIECTMRTIENFMDIKFNYYVKLNFTSFMNIIDALGGIDIEIPYYQTKNGDGTFTTKIYKYDMKPGKTHMDAKQALAFVRERKSFIDGDRIRGQNQQLMIKAVVKKVCSASVITKLDGIFASVADSLETNMTSSEIRALINMQIDDMSPWDVLSYHLDGTDGKEFEFSTIAGPCPNPNGLAVMIPNESTIQKAREYIETVMNNEILKIED